MILISIIGFVISLYTYITELRVKNIPGYKPVCDISDTISCTKPMMSKYGNIFYISNSLLGMMFYISVIILYLMKAKFILLLFSISGVLASFIFAYLLYFKIKSFCLLCVSIYIVNIIIMIMALGGVV